MWSDPDPEKEDFAISPRYVTRHLLMPALHVVKLLIPYSGAGYTFGSGVVHKFLETNNMSHILRAHQLCMEGYSLLFEKHLSTVWSAPNYCYRCGNSASILEVGPGGSMYFNVFEAAPENERDGPSQQASQNAGGKVRYLSQLLHEDGALLNHDNCSYPNISYRYCLSNLYCIITISMAGNGPRC